MANLFSPPRKVQLTLVGINGNAYSVIGAFQKHAKNQQWEKEDIDLVITEAMSGNYQHLLSTIMEHCEDAEEIEDYI